MDDYRVSDRDYLRRCREQIELDTKQGLFYAAFELKCFIEAKLAEYVEHWEGRKSNRVHAFKIGENARTIKKLNIGEIIIGMQFVDVEAGIDETLYHTPVPERLKAFAERYLDDMRHAQVLYRAPDDPWWAEARERLIENYRIAWISSRGTVPVPPLFDWSKPEQTLSHSFVFMYPDGFPSEEKPNALHSHIKAGKTMDFNVIYMEESPKEWVCDL